MSEIKLSDKLQKLVTEIEKLTVIEMADLAKYLEEKFGVSAMPVAATPASASAGTASADKEEKSTFNVVLSASGDNKLGVIKAVREILPNLGLMDAKKLVESAPKDLLTDVKKEVAEEAKKKIEAAGGKVELK
ncbi:MAG: 50S ribosomal protein L7/L12 [Candidatus Roizmanbacteria bacterium GW2011_GWC2_37_13]|uniref:Large ribosomal subunit protein bL12 n=1 Tax=Candidatus Roizmanbacteria bacterium GW2011_GWC2_37_13 TaxID=1618486 RepID=A0A0G0G6F4_9BACT|nr:MAG: LSU ribosomal protein L12P [Candidatus Roizmanbacteria bacterium GW2011_GWC1_37_12]KKQ26673.1 MAG: 50S ribosomal protein L7/L12 [Candidatus Roizmanbacteria bacterium GW2011_GWC2_37_13]